MKIRALLVLAAAFSATAIAEQPPQHIDINGITGDKKGTEMVENVVVPVPSEIFGVLDKQQRVAWAEVLHPLNGVIQPHGSKEQVALMLGAVIAEGFVAVEAENTEEVKNIGRSVLSLSEVLAVKKAVTRRANAIISDANNKDWKDVRKELDGALSDVKTAMNDLRSQDLAQLVSLGGWLRGLDALTDAVSRNYSKEGSELLHQPMLLNYFKERLDAVKKKDPLITKIRQGLDQIEPLIGKGDSDDISEVAVKQIKSIADDLLKEINQKTNP